MNGILNRVANRRVRIVFELPKCLNFGGVADVSQDNGSITAKAGSPGSPNGCVAKPRSKRGLVHHEDFKGIQSLRLGMRPSIPRANLLANITPE
jgi:hypothetical protein